MRSEDVDVISEKKKLQLNREYITYFVNNEVLMMERSYFPDHFSIYLHISLYVENLVCSHAEQYFCITHLI